MATWQAYVSAGVTAVLWTISYAIFGMVWSYVRPMISGSSGASMVTAPVHWVDMLLANWFLFGAVGILLSLFAAGVVNARGGGIAT